MRRPLFPRALSAGLALALLAGGAAHAGPAVLVDLGTEPPPPVELRAPDAVARDTVHALRIVQASEGFDVTAERGYRPDRWAAAPIAAGDGSHA